MRVLLSYPFLGLSLLHFHHLSERRRSLLTAGASLTFFVSHSSFCKNGLLGNPVTHNFSSQKAFETETCFILPTVSSETTMCMCPSWAGILRFSVLSRVCVTQISVISCRREGVLVSFLLLWQISKITYKERRFAGRRESIVLEVPLHNQEDQLL